MVVYLNGTMLDLENAVISPFDRAFQFGDGVYEVVRYYPGKFFEFESHLNRLSGIQSAACGGFFGKFE